MGFRLCFKLVEIGIKFDSGNELKYEVLYEVYIRHVYVGNPEVHL